MLYRVPLRLRTRFILSSTALITLLMMIVVFFVERRQTEMILQREREHGAALARAVADLSVNPLVFYDILALEQNMERAAEAPGVLYAIIFNRKAKALASNGEARRLSPPELFQLGAEMSRLERGRVLMGTVQFETPEQESREVLEVVAPVLVGDEDELWGAVKLGLSLEELNAEIRRTRIGLICLGFLGLTFGALGSVFLAKRISSPLETLVEGTVKVSQGNLNHQIDIAPGDEIGELAANFNQMTAQILADQRKIKETSRKLIEVEKLATIGRLATAMAHEIRNPLAALKLNIQKLGKCASLGDLEKEQVEIAESGIRQVERIVKDILDYARAPKLTKDMFSLQNLIEDALRFVQEQFQEKPVAVIRDYAPELPPIHVDGDKLRQVFLNILLNAAEAVPSGGAVTVRTFLQGEEGKRVGVVQIEDNGCGIEEKNMSSVFEPFFTTKSLGTGLGLTNARKVIELHQGRVEISSTVSVGTTITIHLPYAEEGAVPEEAVEVAHEIHSGH
ncbi:MAG: ATP-binding protein [Acidobacteriota bacterium]